MKEFIETIVKQLVDKPNDVNVNPVESDFKKKFDVICMYHVLEHLPNPTEIINDLKSKLKKNGILILVSFILKCRKFSSNIYIKSFRVAYFN